MINARSIFLTNSTVSASTFSEGAGGNLNIKATDLIQLIGELADGQFRSGLFAQTESRGDAGNLSIETRNLVVRDRSQVSTSTFGEGAGGNLTVKAMDSIQLIGRLADSPSRSGLFAQTESRGDAGNLNIETGNLVVRDGAQVSTISFGEGAGGNLTVKAIDSIQLIGRSANNPFSSGLSTDTASRGDAGNLSIETRNLILRDGAQVGASTLGEGAGGNLTVKAIDSIQLIGTSATDTGIPSGLFADAQPGSRGDAGNLSIETRNLIAIDGGRVISGTLGEGSGGSLTVKATDSIQLIGRGRDGRFSSGLLSRANLPFDAAGNERIDSAGNERIGAAGNTSIETRNLIIRDGAEVRSGTRGAGAGGNLTVNATDSIQISGTWVNGRFPSRLTAQTESSGSAGEITVKTRQLRIENGGEISSRQTTATATGNVGNIRIQAESLSVGNNASITVENRRTTTTRQSTASVGNINIQTNALKVDRGLISAATASTDGGNINLGVQDVLLLRNGGRISTNAGTAQAGGNGGNITFNRGFIVAVSKENSSISANAFSGRGGNIRITTQGLFGIEPRSSTTTGLSSITASSQFGISGTIALNTLNVDPSRGIATLPTGITDINALIASSCVARRNRQGRFVITGTGGLVPQPDDLANSAFPTYELVPQPFAAASTSVIEADRIVRTATGEIVLGRSCH